jgi:hypothetical protein
MIEQEMKWNDVKRPTSFSTRETNEDWSILSHPIPSDGLS